MNWLRLALFLAAGATFLSAQAQIAFRDAQSASAAVGGSGVTYVGAVEAQGGGGQVTLTLPGAAQAGDVVIAVVAVEDETSGSVNRPAAFTLIRGDNAGNHTQITSYRVVSAADNPGTTSWTWDWNGNEDYAAALLVFRGVDTTNPIDADNGLATNSSNTTTVSIPAVTPTVANTLLVAAVSIRSGSTFGSWSGGLTERTDGRSASGGDELGHATATVAGPAAGVSSGNFTVTASDNDTSRVGVLLALRPTTSSLTINVPTGTAAEDVMIASITVRPCSSSNGGLCTVTATAPAGWTLIRTIDQTGGAGTGGYGNRLFVYQRVAGGAEPASYTWTFGGTPAHAGAAGSIASFIGVDNASPVVAESGQATPSALSHATPDISTGTQTNTMLLATHAVNSAATWTAPAGMTERVDIASISTPDDLGLSLVVSTEEQIAAGATGAKSATQASPPAADTGATHLLALRPASPVLQWTMDQTSWNGTAGEVLDSSPTGLHGRAINGANTANATPALGGNPGSCQYANLDGSDDYLEVASNARLDVTDELTVMAWVRPTAYPGAGGLKTIVSKDQNYEFHLTSAGTINWWWGGGALSLTSAGTLALNTWTHVAIVYSRSGAFQRIYINGTPDPNTNNQTGVLATNAVPFQVGGDQGFAGREFAGLIDEVVVYRSALSTAAIQALMNQRRPCVSSIDHFNISHGGSGVACQDQTITITAHDASETAVDAGGLTITLATSNTKGTWTGIVAGGGVLTDATAGDGAASYTFASGSSQVSLSFRYADLAATTETFSFNVSSGALSEASGSALVSDDPSFTLAQAGFQFRNATAGTTVIPTQISGKPSNQGFGAADIRLQAIRTDTKTGSCTGLFASQSRTVELGAECSNPVSCAARLVSINGTSINTGNDNGGSGAAGYTGVSLSFDAASEAQLAIAYPDAGQISLHARYDLDPKIAGVEMLGSSNVFVVRPFGIALRGASAASAVQHGTSATAPVLAAAGDVFTMTLAAYQWAPGEDVAPLDGQPDAGGADVRDITDNGDTPNFAVDATLAIYANLPGVATGAIQRGAACSGAPTVPAAQWANGAATVNDWCYTEAGNVGLFALTNYFGELVVASSSYDGSTLNAGHVGRFVPKRFALDTSGGNAPTLANRAAAGCAPASTFTYLDEGLQLTFRLLAQNTQGGTTQNYTGAYARHDLSGANPVAHFGLGARGAGGNLSARVTAAYQGAAAWSNGVFAASGANGILAIVGRGSPDSPDGPHTAVQFGIAPVDPDGVAMGVLDMDADGNAVNERKGLGVSTELRFGRLRLQNAVGSEKLALPIAVETQYWNGAAFVTNTLDSCTAIPRSAFVLGGYTGALDPAGGNCKTFVQQDPVSFAGGIGTLSLAAPAGGVAGTVLVTPNLGTVPAGSYCDNATSGEDAASAAARSYLLGRWNDAANPDGNGTTAYDDNPASRAAFGLYGAQPGNFIYFRENF